MNWRSARGDRRSAAGRRIKKSREASPGVFKFNYRGAVTPDYGCYIQPDPPGCLEQIATFCNSPEEVPVSASFRVRQKR